MVDDLDRIAGLPYAWLGMTLETDRDDLPYGPAKAHVRRRLEAVRAAVERGLRVQIAVSPVLPYSADFAERLLETGAQRIVVDTFALGDGSRGQAHRQQPLCRRRRLRLARRQHRREFVSPVDCLSR